MTKEKLESVFKFYDRWIELNVCTYAVQHENPKHWVDRYEHLRWMCQTAVNEFIPQGRIEKAMRWLGFIQGVLFEKGSFSLDDLKNHSRPDADADAIVVESKESLK